MTFSIKVKQSELSNIMGALGTLVDEATIEIDADGLKFRGMDPSHIALMDVNYPSSAFESFGVDAPQKFGVRVADLVKIVKRFKDSVELSEKDSMLNISGDGKAYKLRLLEASSSSTPLPKLEFKANVELRDVAILDKALGDIQTVSDYATLEAKSGLFYLSGRGDSGEVNVTISRALDIKTEVKEESKATYSLDYLVKVVKAVKTDKPVKLEYSTKMPLKLSFEDGKLQYFLAPRVQD